MAEREPRSPRFLRWTLSLLISGVVGNAIWSIIGQPLYTNLAYWLTKSQNKFVADMVDRAYAAAVAGSAETVAFKSYAGVVLLVIALLLGLFLITTNGLAAARREVMPAKSFSPEVLERLNRWAHWLVKLHAVDIFYMLMAIATILTAGLMVIRLSIGSITVDAKISFDRSHMALLPYISEPEDRALLGQWARVETKGDYEAIMRRMTKFAADKHAPPLPKREI